jgi:hypothetical protein
LILLQSCLEDRNGAQKVFLFEHIGDTDLIKSFTGCAVESLGRSYHHRLIVEAEIRKHPAHKVFAVLYGQLNYNVEGTLGEVHYNAGYIFEAMEQDIPSRLILLLNWREKIDNP